MEQREFATPKSSSLSKASVHKLAESVASQLGYKPGGDLNEVVAKLGGKITIKDFWNSSLTDSGAIVIQDSGEFEIFVSADTSIERDRFTITHEMGHYILHFMWPRKKGVRVGPMVATRYGTGRPEWEANWFAAAFLMPELEFSTKYAEFGGDINSLADYFGVSQAAAKVRAEGLALIG